MKYGHIVIFIGIILTRHSLAQSNQTAIEDFKPSEISGLINTPY
jgi:low temperature requirement protein LtrA